MPSAWTKDLIAKWPDYQTALAASAEITPIITEVLANVTRDEAIEKLHDHRYPVRPLPAFRRPAG